MLPHFDAATGGDSYAHFRPVKADVTTMVHLDVHADWLPLGKFRPAPERIDTPATHFSFDVDTASRATPTSAELSPAPANVTTTFEGEARTTPGHGADHEAAIRVELLARKCAAPLSPEEDARLKVATERLRRLLPRVTASDFEALADVCDKVAETGREIDALRRELGLE